MSLGLKKYTHQLEQELVDAKFNVNTCDLNLIGVINVLATSGIAPINLNLIFNLENKDEDGLFGKGFKLDLYKKIESKVEILRLQTLMDQLIIIMKLMDIIIKKLN